MCALLPWEVHRIECLTHTHVMVEVLLVIVCTTPFLFIKSHVFSLLVRLCVLFVKSDVFGRFSALCLIQVYLSHVFIPCG